tara:strand:+ start:14896 stop:15837 length:942 start_codon:yes stop_codon:yes gene_type:complete
MPKAHHPRRGSMQFWPRKRSRHSFVRIRSWADSNNAKPLGFIGYKAGMVHVMATDNRPKSLTKGEIISLPATIIECPEMNVAGISFYTKSLSGLRKINEILAEKLDKDLKRKMSLPKKAKPLKDLEFDDLRLLINSLPKKTTTGTKKPKLIEIALGGSKEDKLTFAKENLGKTLTVAQLFENGQLVDTHAVTKGKGFQGTVKRYGVPIKQKKGEKIKRGIGNLGAWTPKRVDYRVPQTGKMGYHLRTEYNKQILKIGENGQEITPKGGFTKFGIVKNNYVLVKGSVTGPRKSAVLMTAAIRPTKHNKEAYQLK